MSIPLVNARKYIREINVIRARISLWDRAFTICGIDILEIMYILKKWE